MSILNRLLLSVTIAMGVILLGTLALNIKASRDYLADQLQAQSTDGAVSLALSLSQPGNSELVMQELLISSMFDGGHFSYISLVSPEREPLVVREIEDAPQYAAPDWFRAMVPIEAKSATHAVSDGWRQIGDVTVVANDVYAWETLWHSSLRMVLLVLSAGLLWIVFAFALVRWIKRKLAAEIGAQVRAMGQGQLQESTHLPGVAEFAEVVQTIDEARAHLRISAAEQEAKVEALELELNRDELTGVANRRYFLNEFRRALSPEGQTSAARISQGYVIILHLRDLAKLNRHMGRRPADTWLSTVCQRLGALLSEQPSALFARLNGADFAILLPVSEQAAAVQLAGRVRAELLRLRVPCDVGDALCRWTISLTDYAPGADISSVLTRLNEGLVQAENADSDEVALMPCKP